MRVGLSKERKRIGIGGEPSPVWPFLQYLGGTRSVPALPWCCVLQLEFGPFSVLIKKKLQKSCAALRCAALHCTALHCTAALHP